MSLTLRLIEKLPSFMGASPAVRLVGEAEGCADVG